MNLRLPPCEGGTLPTELCARGTGCIAPVERRRKRSESIFVARLRRPARLAKVGAVTDSVTRQIIHTDAAPAAIGPYSQAVLVSGGRTLYTSGQIPLNTAGEIVGQGDVRAQTVQVLKNLAAVLEAAGMGWGDVARAGIFLADLGDFAAVNALYAECFPADPPARATVQVAGLPKGVLVEIDLVAVG